ncbi:DUF2703 domain-containing protein [Rapidithrix thailandica]|uniref:DUF2703 domain-containing protein n=1 Tax=Rapidithrix thailandica TaxID=413964 RepID=A0AAW9SAQ6_9BACT
MEVPTKNALRVEFFQVEMTTNANNSCSACDTVQNKLISAIQDVQKLFDKLGCEIFFTSTTVKTIEEAEKAQITASPTIRVGNLDFYPKHLTNGSEKREWTWNGLTMPEPSKEILIEVLLKGYFEPKKENGKKGVSSYVLKYLSESELTKSNCGCS